MTRCSLRNASTDAGRLSHGSIREDRDVSKDAWLPKKRWQHIFERWWDALKESVGFSFARKRSKMSLKEIYNLSWEMREHAFRTENKIDQTLTLQLQSDMRSKVTVKHKLLLWSSFQMIDFSLQLPMTLLIPNTSTMSSPCMYQKIMYQREER